MLCLGSGAFIRGAVPQSTPLRLKNDPISQGCKIPLLLCLLGNVAQLDKMSHNAHPHNHTMRSCTCDSNTILMTYKICKYVQLLYCLLFLFVSLHILSFCNNIDKKLINFDDRSQECLVNCKICVNRLHEDDYCAVFSTEMFLVHMVQ